MKPCASITGRMGLNQPCPDCGHMVGVHRFSALNETLPPCCSVCEMVEHLTPTLATKAVAIESYERLIEELKSYSLHVAGPGTVRVRDFDQSLILEWTAEKTSEVVPEWDVHRDSDGKPVTITEEQVKAIWRAVDVVDAVRKAEGYSSETDWRIEVAKSRLLGRMLLEGKPPTRTKPPLTMGGPDWAKLPGGDPFA
jgi:hypothetical protein